MNPNEIAQQLMELARQLDAAVKELARLELLAVDASSDYTVAFAEAFVNAEGAEGLRRHLAVIATKDAKYNADVASALVRGQQEAIRAIRARIEVGRTVSATVRSEISLGGIGTP